MVTTARSARARTRFIPQMEAVECGAACVAMVLDAHGCGLPLAEARVACDVNRNGSKASMMIKAAAAMGFEGAAYSLGVGDLDALDLPAILHWGFDHFVVLDAVGKKGVTIVDPASGRRKVPLDEVRRLFTGVAINLRPGPDAVLRPSGGSGLRRWLEALMGCRKALSHVLVGSLVLQILSLLFPMASQLVVDRVMATRNADWLWGIAIGVALAIVAERSATLARAWILAEVQAHMDEALMGKFVDHLMALPARFFNQRHAGDLTQRVALNERVRDLMAGQIIPVVLDTGKLLACLVLLLAYSRTLGLITVAFGAIKVAIAFSSRVKATELLAAEMAAGGRETAMLLDGLTGIETVKAGRFEEATLERWHVRMVERMGQSIRRSVLEINMALIGGVVQALTMALVFWLGGREVLAGRMTLGAMMAFLSLQGLFLGPLDTLTSAYWSLRAFRGTLDRLDDVLDTQPDPDGGLAPATLSGAIELQDVTFAYARTLPKAVDGVSLTIRPGERIALVGESGSGKSTLAALLIGEAIPTQGTIRYDGLDLRDLRIQVVRRHIGVVQQGGILFNDSILANIAMGMEGVTMTDARWAATMACLDEDIDALPEGFHTLAGERGNRLSGGQRQRLLVARALAHRPPILLLDEATSALDLDTERRLHANLASVGCTRIVIAHRAMTTLDADRVIVMAAGRIVQNGTPAELLAMAGHFTEMVRHAGVNHA
jgi:ABC-type bacteriocin/lantibiotic exporter with double-glycine peptidase domain